MRCVQASECANGILLFEERYRPILRQPVLEDLSPARARKAATDDHNIAAWSGCRACACPRRAGDSAFND